MKKLLLAFTAMLLTSGAFVSCSDSTDGSTETGPVVLTPNKTEILANGTDKVTFTVMRGDADHTSDAEIWQIGEGGGETKLGTPGFTTKTIGNYKFEARYTVNGETLVSDAVSIKSIEVPKEVYYRRIFAQQFTSVNCTSCPQLTQTLETLAKTDEWKDRLVHASFHTDFSGTDPMDLKITLSYKNQLKFSGYPACVLDLMPDTYILKEMDPLVEQMTRVLNEYPAMCGVAIESKYDSDTRKLDITAKTTVSHTNEYRMLCFLLEDGIIAYQSGSTQGTLYEHNNTVRIGLADNINGDKLGMINAGSEVTHTFSTTLDGAWKANKMRIIVCVLNKVNDAFYINNSAMCALGDSTDYKMNE